MNAEPISDPATDLGAARRWFRDVPLAHVGSVDRDGAAHVVPLWFVWLEDAIYLSSREGSRVAENVRRATAAAVSVQRGLAWVEQSGVLVRGPADVLPTEHSSSRRALSAWFEKYRQSLAGPNFAAYTAQVERPVVIRVRPAWFRGWRHDAPAQA